MCTLGMCTLGVDPSGRASRSLERAGAAEIDSVECVEADPHVHPLEAGAFDAMISRFGTMFFGGPAAAFANDAESHEYRASIAL